MSASSGSALSVVVIDDDKSTRDLVRAVLATEHDVTVVGEASTGSDGLLMVLALRPDVVIIDIALPDMSGLNIIRGLQARSKRPRLIAYTADDRAIDQARAAGADAAVLKDGRLEALIAALRA